MTTLDVCQGVSEAALRARGGAKWTRYDPDVLGAWVADMDFAVAEPVRAAVIDAAELSAFGYPGPHEQERVFAACSEWLRARHGWMPDPAQFALLCDVVQGIQVAIHTLTEPGDGIIVQSPIYPPFLTSVTALERRVLDNRLLDPTGSTTLDLEGLARLAADPRATLLLLCNPHNPTGRVFTRAELEAIAGIALEHDLTVIADEIWMDIVYPGHRFIPFQTLGPEVAARTITLTSATKSFNLGGMRCAVAIFGSPALRERFDALPPRIRGTVNCLATRATVAAWTSGAPWLDAVVRQLDENRALLSRFVAERLPRVRMPIPQGTYLAWLDFSAVAPERSASELLLERARVGCNDGGEFGGDTHCARLNFATSPALLSEILERIAAAVA